jgi:hypothetical protein
MPPIMPLFFLLCFFCSAALSSSSSRLTYYVELEINDWQDYLKMTLLVKASDPSLTKAILTAEDRIRLITNFSL